MGIRPKLFLIFFIFGIVPMTAFGWLLYWNGTRSVETLLQSDVERDTAGIVREVESALREREEAMSALARSERLRQYVRAESTSGSTPAPSGSALQTDKKSLQPKDVPPDVQADINAFFLSHPKRYVSITCFSAQRQPVFRAEVVARESSASGEPEAQFHTEIFVSPALLPEPAVWDTAEPKPLRPSAVSGATLRYTIPVFTGEQGTPAPRGALIVELSGDELFAQAALGRADESQASTRAADFSHSPRFVVMLDRTGHILYHTRVALRHQPVNSMMPAFTDIAGAMTAQESGSKDYDEESTRWRVSYRPLNLSGVSVAVAGNYSTAMQGVRRLGWIALALLAVFGLLMVVVLTRVARGTARSIERVTEGAVAIAGGKLDQRIEVRSSDETRLLAESFNIMTDKLREQIARETESRQFESFMRLSAMLTHDLKNAIASLSLLVNNMQRQFHREEFRADAMKSLIGATDKLRALVSKLSEPVQSLSSEHQLPRPTDLVKIIRRVLDVTVEPVQGIHHIEINLPDTLVATVEVDRIEKVFENLVINALEAMGAKSGKLTVKAGPTAHGKVYFLVSDTGPGMSEEFKRTKLFRAFATTKKSGVGLGLYTCREIVRTHGGHIDVESKRGSGTTFRVVLPSEQTIMGRPAK